MHSKEPQNALLLIVVQKQSFPLEPILLHSTGPINNSKEDLPPSTGLLGRPLTGRFPLKLVLLLCVALFYWPEGEKKEKWGLQLPWDLLQNSPLRSRSRGDVWSHKKPKKSTKKQWKLWSDSCGTRLAQGLKPLRLPRAPISPAPPVPLSSIFLTDSETL